MVHMSCSLSGSWRQSISLLIVAVMSSLYMYVVALHCHSRLCTVNIKASVSTGNGPYTQQSKMAWHSSVILNNSDHTVMSYRNKHHADIISLYNSMQVSSSKEGSFPKHSAATVALPRALTVDSLKKSVVDSPKAPAMHKVLSFNSSTEQRQAVKVSLRDNDV